MLKRSMSVGLLCLTGQVYANISITTTEDIVKDDDVCSLREAITYVNDYLSDPKKKDDGYFGCGGKDATALIILEKDKTYTLNSEVAIKKALTIQTKTEEFNFDDKKSGLTNATIKASGQHRLFNIDDGKSEISQITVNFNQINLEGCGSEKGVCADQGGLIYNRESLSFNYSKLSNGFANQGGAIYSDGIIAGDNTSSASFINFTNSIAINNKAKNGAVFYMGQPLFNIQRSIIRNNSVIDNEGALIYSANAFDDKTTNTDTFSRVASIRNSTLFKNVGFLLNVRDGIYINNATMVDNTKGIYFNAPNEKAHVSNSILAGNNGQDCAFSTADETHFYNNLVENTTLCRVGEVDTGNGNFDLATQRYNKLIAGNDSEGKCDAPPAEGLLCPFNTPKDTFIGFFKPRLLTAYTHLNDSPIINRGRLFSDGKDQGAYSCEGSDQRGLSRGENVHCDLGAIELVVRPENVNRLGDDILFGQILEMSILDNLADGELWPASECKAVFKSDVVPDNQGWVNGGQPWNDGCYRIAQSAAVTPQSKGKLELKEVAVENGQAGETELKLVYTPNGHWHGLDEFNLHIMTTASRFSDAEQSRDIIVPIKVTQAPPDNFKSSKIKVSGGSIGMLSIVGLFVLAIRRRIKA